MTDSFRVDRHVDTKVPMRDGVQLAADRFLPRGAGPRPTVLMRTPYSNSLEATIEKGQRLADGVANILDGVIGEVLCDYW